MTSGDNSSSMSSEPQALYQHIKRKDWGLAIMAWQRDDRRAYQFEDGKLRTNGGRVLCATAMGDTVSGAQQLAYQIVEQIKWRDAFYRTDIAYRAIARE